MVPKTCTIDGCVMLHLAKGLCSKHYHRKLRTGRTQRPTPAERLWAKVVKTEGCWLWTGAKSPEGYGRILHMKRNDGPHRLSYELAYGQIPSGAVIDHMCYNPSCVRPSHLQAVTTRQNIENRAGMQINNTSGVRGVSWNAKRKKWCAQVTSEGKSYNAGRYSSLADAEAAVIAKRNELFTNNLKDRQVTHGRHQIHRQPWPRR